MVRRSPRPLCWIVSVGRRSFFLKLDVENFVPRPFGLLLEEDLRVPSDFFCYPSRKEFSKYFSIAQKERIFILHKRKKKMNVIKIGFLQKIDFLRLNFSPLSKDEAVAQTVFKQSPVGRAPNSTMMVLISGVNMYRSVVCSKGNVWVQQDVSTEIHNK